MLQFYVPDKRCSIRSSFLVMGKGKELDGLELNLTVFEVRHLVSLLLVLSKGWQAGQLLWSEGDNLVNVLPANLVFLCVGLESDIVFAHLTLLQYYFH
jgi:hypothetical protein